MTGEQRNLVRSLIDQARRHRHQASPEAKTCSRCGGACRSDSVTRVCIRCVPRYETDEERIEARRRTWREYGARNRERRTAYAREWQRRRAAEARGDL